MYGVAYRFRDPGCQRSLGDKPCQMARQQVAASTLTKIGIAGAVDRGGMTRIDDDSAIAFQHDVAITQPFAERLRCGDTIRLDLGRADPEQAGRLAGMRRDDPDGGDRVAGRNPVQCAGIGDDRHWGAGH